MGQLLISVVLFYLLIIMPKIHLKELSLCSSISICGLRQTNYSIILSNQMTKLLIMSAIHLIYVACVVISVLLLAAVLF